MNNKHQIADEFQALKTNFADKLRSPKVIATALIVGFICTFKGKHKKHVVNFAKNHVTQHYAQLPLVSGALQFIPLIYNFFKRRKASRK